MRATHTAEFSLYTPRGARKYLNASERRIFLRTARKALPEVRLFCLTLFFTGARISEILALTPAAIDLDSGVACLRTLKRRKMIYREVPLPRELIRELNRTFRLRSRQKDELEASTRIWRWCRTTAWTRVKELMAHANITGVAASPKALRHAFGVHAYQSYVPPHLVQRWLGHASLRTTSIYADVMGPDERQFASRMWGRCPAPRSKN